MHTVRDADRWYDSTAETIYRARDVLRSGPLRFVPQIRDLYEILDGVIWDGMFDGRFEDRTHAIEVYEQWTSQVVDVAGEGGCRNRRRRVVPGSQSFLRPAGSCTGAPRW